MLHPDVLHDGPVPVDHGGEVDLVPPRGPLRTPEVEDGLPALPTTLDGRADAGDRSGIGVGPLQEPAVPAEHLAVGHTGELLEGLVDEDERLVGTTHVGDGHAACGGSEGPAQEVLPVRRHHRWADGPGDDGTGRPRTGSGPTAALTAAIFGLASSTRLSCQLLPPKILMRPALACSLSTSTNSPTGIFGLSRCMM